MDHAAFDRFLALNAHLTALAAAGVPIDLGVGANDTAAEVERLNAQVALEVGRGRSLEAVLTDRQQLPAAYCSAVLAALRSDDPLAVLESVFQPASARDHLRRSTVRMLVGPGIVFIVACVAFIYLCQYVSPELEAIYKQFNEKLSAPASLLVAGRLWLPYWAPVVLLSVLGGMGILWGWAGFQRVGWIPGARRYLDATNFAGFSSQLARLIEHNVPLADALPIAAGQTSDRHLVSGAKVIADARRRGHAVDYQQPEVQGLPPLLRWSLTSQPGLENLATNLRFAAEFYHHSAQLRIARVGFAFPAVGGALLSGAIVFAYGLAVFTPIVQLLVEISR